MSLCLEQIEFEYDAGTLHGVKALRNVSLTIDKQEFIGVIGASGSGKSTLLQVAGGLLQPAGGRVLFNEKNIYDKRFNRKAYHKKVGIVFQYPEAQLFEETVLKDVMFGLKNYGSSEQEAKQLAMDTLQSLDISEELFYQSPFQLSGGEQRRVAIAGVLAMKPEILLLDEPTAGLNPQSGRSLLKQLKNMGITILLASHNMEEIAEFSTRVIAMQQGEIWIDGPTQEVFSEIDRLEELGLEAPSALKVIQMLREEGYAIQENPLTPKDAADAIAALFDKMV